MPNYDSVILEKLYARKQSDREKVSTYVGDMSKLIQQLTKTMPEDEQVRLIFINMALTLRLMLCMKSHESLIQLVADATVVETRLEQTALKVENSPSVPNVNRPIKEQPKGKLCYNCGNSAHLIAQCPFPKKKREQRVSAVNPSSSAKQENEQGTE